MLYAAEKGNLKLVEYHLRMGEDPNYRHPEFLTTPLIVAVETNQYDVAKLLLKYGANPHVRDCFTDLSPITLAKNMGNKELSRLFQNYLTETS
jgi:ankyrin repeat protein